MTHIYILKLENNKYYVGKSLALDARIIKSFKAHYETIVDIF